MSVKSWLFEKGIQGKLPDWLYLWIGKEVGKKLDEEEAIMKSKWASKTVWVAIIGAIVAGVQPVSTALGHPFVIPNWFLEVLGAAGLYGLRTGDKTLI